MAEKNTVVLKGRVTGNSINWKDEKISRITVLTREDDGIMGKTYSDCEVEGWFRLGAEVKVTIEIKG